MPLSQISVKNTAAKQINITHTVLQALEAQPYTMKSKLVL
jgi:hypothetical protein